MIRIKMKGRRSIIVLIIKEVLVIFSAKRIPPSISSEISINNSPENKRRIRINGIPFTIKKISILILLFKTAILCLKVLNSIFFGASAEKEILSNFTFFDLLFLVFDFLKEKTL
ncbi:hypothetical protein D3C85_1361180 [compost metagenome]